MTTQTPLISVCLPTYNRSDWLRVGLMALTPMMQKAGGLVEVVVSDNCSPDNGKTARLVNEFQSQYTLRYSRQEENIGLYPNIAATVTEMARGEYVWVLGDDDVVCNDSLLRILEVLQEKPHLDFVLVNHLDYHGAQPLGGAVAPESVTLYNNDFEDRYLPQIKEIVPVEPNCFTAIYSFLLRRTHAIKAFQYDAINEPFTSVATVAPHAMYIINTLSNSPGWYVGQPGVIASSSISWMKFRAQFGLVLMHDLYDLLEANGAAPAVMETMRRQRLRFTSDLLWEMLTDPHAGHCDRFSLWEYQKRHGHYPELWQTMSELAQRAQATPASRLAKAA